MKNSIRKALLNAVAVSIAVLVGLAFVPAVQAAEQITVTIDGVPVHFADQQPVIIDGRTLVPVRGVFEQLGFYVTWDGEAQQATLTRADFTVVIAVGSTTFTTNGASRTLDVPAQIIGGRTMLPIRHVLESVGYTLDWNQAAQTVLITTVQPEPPTIADVAEYVPEPETTTFVPTPIPTPTPTPTTPTTPLEPPRHEIISDCPYFIPDRYGAHLTRADGMAEAWYDIVDRHADGTITVRTNTGNLVRIGIDENLLNTVVGGGASGHPFDCGASRTGVTIYLSTLGEAVFGGGGAGLVRDPNSYHGQLRGGYGATGIRAERGPIRTGGGIVEVTQPDGTSLGEFMIGDDGTLIITGLETGGHYRVTLIQPPIGFTNRQFNRGGQASIDANGNLYFQLTDNFIGENRSTSVPFLLIAED